MENGKKRTSFLAAVSTLKRKGTPRSGDSPEPERQGELAVLLTYF